MKKFSLITWTLLQILFIQSNVNAFEVPDFIKRVPSGHYTGVSAPCTDLQKARLSAISDIVRQILGSINAEYNYSYINKVSGVSKNPRMSIRDDFSMVSSGVVLDVEKNITRASHTLDSTGRYVCFILVKYPDSKIEDMQRLSKGAKIIGYILSESAAVLRVKVTETNGVAVILSSADIHISKKYRFAKMINFCIWKVPYGSDRSFSIAIDPIRVLGGSSIVAFDISQYQKDWKDYLLGTKQNYQIRIKGFDEIGRPVSSSIEF